MHSKTMMPRALAVLQLWLLLDNVTAQDCRPDDDAAMREFTFQHVGESYDCAAMKSFDACEQTMDLCECTCQDFWENSAGDGTQQQGADQGAQQQDADQGAQQQIANTCENKFPPPAFVLPCDTRNLEQPAKGTYGSCFAGQATLGLGASCDLDCGAGLGVDAPRMFVKAKAEAPFAYTGMDAQFEPGAIYVLTGGPYQCADLKEGDEEFPKQCEQIIAHYLLGCQRTVGINILGVDEADAPTEWMIDHLSQPTCEAADAWIGAEQSTHGEILRGIKWWRGYKLADAQQATPCACTRGNEQLGEHVPEQEEGSSAEAWVVLCFSALVVCATIVAVCWARRASRDARLGQQKKKEESQGGKEEGKNEDDSSSCKVCRKPSVVLHAASICGGIFLVICLVSMANIFAGSDGGGGEAGSSYQCIKEYSFPHTHVEELPAYPGPTCSAEGVLSTGKLNPTGSVEATCKKCPHMERCLAGGVCSEGTTGFMCSKCSPAAYNQSLVKKCQNNCRSDQNSRERDASQEGGGGEWTDAQVTCFDPCMNTCLCDGEEADENGHCDEPEEGFDDSFFEYCDDTCLRQCDIGNSGRRRTQEAEDCDEMCQHNKVEVEQEDCLAMCQAMAKENDCKDTCASNPEYLLSRAYFAVGAVCYICPDLSSPFAFWLPIVATFVVWVGAMKKLFKLTNPAAEEVQKEEVQKKKAEEEKKKKKEKERKEDGTWREPWCGLCTEEKEDEPNDGTQENKENDEDNKDDGTQENKENEENKDNAVAFVGIGVYHLQISSINIMTPSIPFPSFLTWMIRWISIIIGFDLSTAVAPECYSDTGGNPLWVLEMKVAMITAMFWLVMLLLGCSKWLVRAFHWCKARCKARTCKLDDAGKKMANQSYENGHGHIQNTQLAIYTLLLVSLVKTHIVGLDCTDGMLDAAPTINGCSQAFGAQTSMRGQGTTMYDGVGPSGAAENIYRSLIVPLDVDPFQSKHEGDTPDTEEGMGGGSAIYVLWSGFGMLVYAVLGPIFIYCKLTSVMEAAEDITENGDKANDLEKAEDKTENKDKANDLDKWTWVLKKYSKQAYWFEVVVITDKIARVTISAMLDSDGNAWKNLAANTFFTLLFIALITWHTPFANQTQKDDFLKLKAGEAHEGKEPEERSWKNPRDWCEAIGVICAQWSQTQAKAKGDTANDNAANGICSRICSRIFNNGDTPKVDDPAFSSGDKAQMSSLIGLLMQAISAGICLASGKDSVGATIAAFVTMFSVGMPFYVMAKEAGYEMKDGYDKIKDIIGKIVKVKIVAQNVWEKCCSKANVKVHPGTGAQADASKDAEQGKRLPPGNFMPPIQPPHESA